MAHPLVMKDPNPATKNSTVDSGDDGLRYAQKLRAEEDARNVAYQAQGKSLGIKGALGPGDIVVGGHPHPAPTRATTLPSGSADRKKYPVGSGVLDYFPDAMVAVARVSFEGNEQHNPGEPLHWARGKSMDQNDTMLRHYLQRGTLDTDGLRHSAKMAWRALAILQLEIEAEWRQKVVAGYYSTGAPALFVKARPSTDREDE